MGPGFVARRASEKDLIDILGIEKVSFPTPWPISMYLPYFGEDNVVFLVAEKDGKIAGYACSYLVLDEVHLLKIAVEPKYRRRGVGALLMSRLGVESAARGGAIVWLEVRHGNESGVKFYRRLGFAVVAVRKKYYADTGEDAIVMAKRLEEDG